MANISIRSPGLWSTAVPNRGPVLIIVTTVLLLLTTAFFAARVIWQYKNRQRGWDDIMAAAAWTILVTQTTLGGMAAHYGFGKHRNDTPSTFSSAMEYFYLYWICFMLLSTFTKLTFCCLYLRVFRDHRMIKSIVKLVTLITVLGGITFTLGTVWQCVPIQAAWTGSLKGGHCINKTAFYYCHAALNTLMDLIIYALPIFALRTLQTTRTNKIGLITIFALGAFVISASIARMAFLKDSTGNTSDPTWDSMQTLTWTGIESSFAMILCCLPALGPSAIQLWCKLTGKPYTSSRRPGTGRAPSAHDWYDFSGRNHGHNPGTGMFTNIHASPNASPIQSSYDLSAPVEPHNGNKWVDRLKSPFGSHSNNNIHDSNDSTSSSSAELRRPASVHPSPKIELGNMYRPTTITSSAATNVTDLRGKGPVWKHSPWMNKSRGHGGVPRGLGSEAEARNARTRWGEGDGTSDLAEFLRAGPQIDVVKTLGMEGGYTAGKGKG